MPCHAALCAEEGGLDYQQTRLERVSFTTTRHLPPWLLENVWGVFIKGAAIVGGLSLFVPWIPAPVSLTRTLGHWESILWGVLLVIGGIAGLYGLLRDKYLPHVAGLVMIGAPLLIYGISVFLYRGKGAFVNALLLVTLGVGCYVRALVQYVVHSTARQRQAIHTAYLDIEARDHDHPGEASAGPGPDRPSS